MIYPTIITQLTKNFIISLKVALIKKLVIMFVNVNKKIFLEEIGAMICCLQKNVIVPPKIII